MMGTQVVGTQLSCEFNLDTHVPPNHVLRENDRFLDMAPACGNSLGRSIATPVALRSILS